MSGQPQYGQKIRTQARQMYDKGASARTIGKELGVGISTISLWMQQAGLIGRRGSSVLKFSEHTQGWLEGMIDGEGTITFRKKKSSNGTRCRRGFSWEPTLYICNTDRNLVNRALSVIGKGYIQARKADSPKHKPLLAYKLTGSRAVFDVLDQLSLVTKERQRVLVTEACKLLAEHRSWGHTPNDVRLEVIWKEVRTLNMGRGPQRL